jgi:hypothetical protein
MYSRISGVQDVRFPPPHRLVSSMHTHTHTHTHTHGLLLQLQLLILSLLGFVVATSMFVSVLRSRRRYPRRRTLARRRWHHHQTQDRLVHRPAQQQLHHHHHHHARQAVCVCNSRVICTPSSTKFSGISCACYRHRRLWTKVSTSEFPGSSAQLFTTFVPSRTRSYHRRVPRVSSSSLPCAPPSPSSLCVPAPNRPTAVVLSLFSLRVARSSAACSVLLTR